MNEFLESASQWILHHMWWLAIGSSSAVVLASALQPWWSKDVSKLKMLLYLVSAQIVFPVLFELKGSATEEVPWVMTLWTLIAANTSWLVASGFDPMGPFSWRSMNGFEETTWREELWHFYRKPPVVFWPVAVLIFGFIMFLLLD